MKHLVLVSFLSVFIGACALEGEEIVASHQAASTENALSINALSINSFELDTGASGGLENTVEGRSVLKYVSACALADGVELVVEVDDETFHFPGRLGLAAEWLDEPLSDAGKAKMSACLLAHVNAYGVSVPISLRHPELYTSQEERKDYRVYEATFYGDVFSSDMQMYGCWGDAPKKALNHSADRALRVCSDPISADSAATECSASEQEPFVATGFCKDVCDTKTPKQGWSGCYTDASKTGDRYDETISAWLLRD